MVYSQSIMAGSNVAPAGNQGFQGNQRTTFTIRILGFFGSIGFFEILSLS
jgi:hypothetical protein